MKILISNSSADPIYIQISRQLKNLMITGELKEGEALPSIRKLARKMGISVITTKRAYEELEKDGFIDTVGGKGCFVSEKNHEFLKEKRKKIIEDKLFEAITEARQIGVSDEEITDMFKILLREV